MATEWNSTHDELVQRKGEGGSRLGEHGKAVCPEAKVWLGSVGVSCIGQLHQQIAAHELDRAGQGAAKMIGLGATAGAVERRNK